MTPKKKRRYGRKKEELKSEVALNWILKFAWQELPGQRQKEWDDLFESVRQFLIETFNLSYYWNERPGMSFPDFIEQLEKGVPRKLKNKELMNTLQKKLREALEHLFPKEWPEDGDARYPAYWPVPGPRPYLVFRSNMYFGVPVPARKTKGDTGSSKTKYKEEDQMVFFQSLYFAEWPTIFWIAVGEALQGVYKRLRRCEMCKEKRLYVKTKGQAYCSLACSQKVRAQKWYAKHKTEYNAKRKKAKEQMVEKNMKTIVLPSTT